MLSPTSTLVRTLLWTICVLLPLTFGVVEDGSASGSRLRFSGSPLLAHSIRRVAQDLPHPTEANRTLWDAREDDGQLFGEDKLSITSAAKEMDNLEHAFADTVGVNPLGSGSDYTVFLQRIGVRYSITVQHLSV